MLKIDVPNNFIPERSYIIDVLFSELLETEYSLTFSKREDCQISYGNVTLVLSDSFWHKSNDEDRHLSVVKLPEKIEELAIPSMSDSIVVIYGKSKLEIVQNEDGSTVVHCGADIFASAFFMLTRWEENVQSVRDEHGRFPYTSSLAWKNGFHNRPVVNEYANFFRHFLESAGISFSFRRQFRFFSTCDIDFIFKWKSIISWSKTFTGDIFVRHSISLTLRTLYNLLKSPFSKHTDPYNQYSRLLRDGQKSGAYMVFYLLMNKANIKTLKRHGSWLFSKLESKSAMIGLHPDYDSYLANGQMQKEKLALEEVYGKSVDESRQHYLRFSVSETWSMLNKRGIAFDSSMYYTEVPGFRTGCCSEYSCFDVQYRKRLDIKERTLCFMDTSVFYDAWQKNGTLEYLKALIEQVKKHRGDFVMLWHNSSFDPAVWSEKIYVYEQIIEYFSNTHR